MYVGVVGPGDDATPNDVQRAYEVGRLLATGGAVVVTGGLGGVMAAALEGASSVGGTSVALLPGGDRSTAGSSATVVVATGLGEGRNAVLVRTVDALIAVGGSWGTLSEVSLALRAEVPVVCIRGWSVADATGVPLEVRTADEPAAAVRSVLDR